MIANRELCIGETNNTVRSISTTSFVPQPIDYKIHVVGNRIFLGDIPMVATPSDLKKLFRLFGEVIEANIVCSGTKNFGFVTFKETATAEKVLSLSSQGRHFYIRGYTIKVKPALFQPRKNSSNFKYSRRNVCLSQSDIGGHKVVQCCANGMVYYNAEVTKPVLFGNSCKVENTGGKTSFFLSSSTSVINMMPPVVGPNMFNSYGQTTKHMLPMQKSYAAIKKNNHTMLSYSMPNLNYNMALPKFADGYWCTNPNCHKME